MKCDVEANKVNCTCTCASCSLKGKCCECVERHLKKDEIPGCFFPPEYEKLYDRSIRKFIEAHSQ